MVFESHSQDCRYRHLGEVCGTIEAAYGLGGGNIPIVLVISDDEDESVQREEV